MRFRFKCAVLLTLLLVAGAALSQDQAIKPFVVASSNDSGLEETTLMVTDALAEAGFEVAGQYSPISGTQIVVVTNDQLRSTASASGRGAYAAGQRISVSVKGDKTEVGFVNPLYIQHAYRLEADMQPVYDSLTSALGHEGFCGGGDKKMTSKKLRKYHYMMTMPYFDDPSELGSFESYEDAVSAVENGLALETDGLTKVYRIDIPGKQQTVFGVGMKSTGEDDENIDETAQMNVVDFEGCRKHAYFPYEVLVTGNEVEALHMKFRMAVHFPNLPMTGKHGFTKLMPFPKAIEKNLEKMVSGE